MWRDSQLQLLWTARVDYASGSRVESHVHEDHSQLLVAISGAGTVDIGGVSHELKADHAYLFLTGVPHRFHFTQETVTIDFKFRLLDQEIAHALHSISPCQCCSNSEVLELQQWHQLSRTHLKSSPSYPLIRIEAGLKSTLASLFLLQSEPEEQPASAFPIDHDDPMAMYIKAHLAERITLEQLSRQFGFHPTYLIRIFSQQTGMTPIQYLQEVRLEQARRYLEFTRMPIAEVAERVGWTLPYFSKLIKKKFGLPPLQYRESLTNEVGEDIVLESDFSNEWRIRS
ncbi:helix-turn-helix domain-containing protein [Paenibacillus sp. 1P07SE]|uniref:helix-turn-helix transcriptional regulator n=1 Tax=Paenibacillus sp. 1P07SE TaxID=3132209 RepID=UPI0039A60C0A